MLKYDKLWLKLSENFVSSYTLQKVYGFSSASLTSMKSSHYITTATLEKFCSFLKCSPEDILETKEDEELIRIVAEAKQRQTERLLKSKTKKGNRLS